jgi:hypothetical protein
LWDITTDLSDTRDGRLLSSTFAVFAVVLPLVHLAMTGAIWLTPLSLTMQQQVSHAVDVVGAWAALDMSLVTMILAFVQVGQFAQFIVGDKCNVLLPILDLPEMNTILDGDDVCMDVHVAILPALWWLAGVAVVGTGTTFYVSHKLREAIQEGLQAWCDGSARRDSENAGVDIGDGALGING